MLDPIIAIENFAAGCSLHPYEASENQVYLAEGVNLEEDPFAFTPAGKVAYEGGSFSTDYLIRDYIEADVNLCTAQVVGSGTNSSSLATVAVDAAGNLSITAIAGAATDGYLVRYGDKVYILDGAVVNSTDLSGAGFTVEAAFTGVNNFIDAIVALDNTMYLITNTSNGITISKYDELMFEADVFEIEKRYTIQEIIEVGPDRIGILATHSQGTRLYLWDGFSPKPSMYVDIPEQIYTWVYSQGLLWLLGEFGLHIATPGLGQVVKVKNWELASMNGGHVNRRRMTYSRGRIYFSGRLTVSGLTTQGIFSFLPNIENLSFLKERTIGTDIAIDNSGNFGEIFAISQSTGYLLSNFNSSAGPNVRGGVLYSRSRDVDTSYTVYTPVYEAPAGRDLYIESIVLFLRENGTNILFELDDATVTVSVRSDSNIRNELENGTWQQIESKADPRFEVTAYDYGKKVKQVQFKIEVSTTNTGNIPSLRKMYVTGAHRASEL